MIAPLNSVALEVLSRVEAAEAELLTWGVVDGCFFWSELVDIAQPALLETLRSGDFPYANADALLLDLLEHNLLFVLPPTPGKDGKRYRSRTAEAVRLMFRLKQLFPKHLRNGTWRSGKDLVADYRLILRPRRYPRRHLRPDVVRTRLFGCGLKPALEAALTALLTSRSGDPYELADFQVAATVRILSELGRKPRRSGTIVCAGTGSGKTLSFYLPALLTLADQASDEAWVRCLAFYPRNELLKDQLSSAIRQTTALNRLLAAGGKPTVAVGALFGDVPNNANDTARLDRNWIPRRSEHPRGHICPYLTCPSPSCTAGQLCWTEDDRTSGVERLVCLECRAAVGPENFVLTRASMREKPPDLLFTSLELVNQGLTSVQERRVLGVDIRNHSRRPRLVLLDEAHTYSGTYGAQAALLLRRWKRASGAAPHFVGLSATLEDAQRFFADLIGESPSRVTEISPREEDLVTEGQEVLLALRGDPISKASLLSTTIQASLLLRRVLDPAGTTPSYLGSKLFAFTDDLDVTNRLFHDLADAEGWSVNWRGLRAERASLAALRSRDRIEGDHAARFRAGQAWDLVEEIGHELGGAPRVQVGRTSSQDAGVHQDAETVVATASLEVGFDDPAVGAVIQHKAPRDAASFLQRKGRAGRPRGTRPWTVVVLSDFGRDRIAYQGYDQLFSPELRPRYLPVRNRHVLRMQAVFATLDWLTDRLHHQYGDDRAYLWPTLSQPPRNDRFLRYNLKRLDRIADLAEDVLRGGTEYRRLCRYLEQALQVSTETVQQLMWTPPRPLALAALPTILRRCRRRWEVAMADGETRHEPYGFWAPLPEFVPSALFSDLNLPEVTIELPDSRDDDEHMPVLQALREFAPGRVSRRFGVSHRSVAHWLPAPDLPGQSFRVDDFFGPHDLDVLGRFRVQSDNGVKEVVCLRPRRIRVATPPQQVSPSSNGRMMWSWQLLPRVGPVALELPAGSPWNPLIGTIGFFTHGYGNAIEVRRFALGSRYEVRQVSGDALSGTTQFVRSVEQGTEDVALGYAVDADAIRLEVSVPLDLRAIAARQPSLLRALRTARFSFLLQSNDELEGVANSFERDWLAQICLSALLLEAVESGCSLKESASAVFDEQAQVPLLDVLEVIFQASEADGATEGQDRRGEIRHLLADPIVQHALQTASTSLWVPPDATWERWLQHRFKSTLGAAFLEACQQVCPDVDSGDLCLDIGPGVRGQVEGCEEPTADEIWLSETSPGGSGVVEAVARAYAADPRHFLNLVEAALGPSDFEDVDVQLGQFVGMLVQDSSEYDADLAALVSAFRSANSHAELLQETKLLRQQMDASGLSLSHAVAVAIQSRILRPGSNVRTDSLLHSMLAHWAGLEERLGVEVDAKVIAYSMSAEPDLDDALSNSDLAPPGDARRQWRYGALYGLLWPRGSTVRSQSLQAYNPFVNLPPPDRLLVLHSLPRATREVRLAASDWYARAQSALINEGEVLLVSEQATRSALAGAIRELLVRPMDTGALLVSPVVTGIIRESGDIRVRMAIREGMQ